VVDAGKISAEIVFAFDGEAPPPPDWLDHPGVSVVQTGARLGPAAARNRAAEAASGRILMFVDADVELAADAIERIHAAFEADPDLVGIFGTYDDDPPGNGVASAFRNLLHHHTHTSNPGRAGTFWAGCGAIRTAEFLDIGGFEEAYAFPSVEDIELGMRVTAAGGRIVLDPTIRCKHLKQWTMASMIFTDIVHRATPWTHLIIKSRSLPATLNLDWRSRFSGICSVLLLVCLAAAPFAAPMAWLALACGLAVLVMNIDFYRLCRNKRGTGFAISAVMLHWLYFAYSFLTFGLIAARELWVDFSRTSPCPSRSATIAMSLAPQATHEQPRVGR
jgi:GT2 family glycosyltransferase